MTSFPAKMPTLVNNLLLTFALKGSFARFGGVANIVASLMRHPQN